MSNKFLITIIIPEIEMEYDTYIPNNKKIGTIKKTILESLKELSDSMYDKTIEEVRFFDRDNAIEYSNNLYVKDTRIKNGSRLIIL